MSDRAQIERIKRNAAALQRVETCEYPDFFRRRHNFRFNPPASLEQVLAYEAKYGFAFPAGYREFILEVGDGGAGPFYGLKQRFTFFGQTLREREGSLGSRPTIYRKAALGEDWKTELLGSGWGEMDDDDLETLFFQGTLSLCDVGCAIEIVLALNGPLAGCVIQTDYGFTVPAVWQPSAFLDFYEEWQAAVLEGWKHTESRFAPPRDIPR